MDATASVDDFIKELEAKEKDLHITADLKIEIEESEFDPNKIPDFVQQDLGAPLADPARATANGHTPGAKTQIFELQNEVESLKERLADLKAERNDVQEKSDRRLKDFESYKYRMDRERRGAFIDQISNLASQMLPVLDNLDRALVSVESLKAKKSDEFQQFYDGIALVNQHFNDIFSDMGVQPIATVGETFDPNFHEAVAADESSELPPNTITAEMLRGYRIGNRVIRHSMVKVTSAPPSAKKEAEKEVAKEEIKELPETPATPIPEPEELLPDPTDLSDLDALFPDEAE